jgi:MFS family permease
MFTGPSHRYFILIILMIAYILSFIDRNIMAILVEPIRKDFNITDFEYGLLNGLAFSLLYTVLGVPIGWFADRSNRKNIMAVGTAFWSVMTFLCGVSSSFVTLFLARVGVGIGEAALSPPAHSLLSDYFEKDKLPVIMSIFTLGIPIGVGVSYSVGGWVYGLFAGQETVIVPMLGELKPWQATFMIVGAPGLIVAWFISKIIEPHRTGVMVSEAGDESLSFSEIFIFISANKRVYLSIYGAVASLAIMGYGFMMWYVAHMSRVYEVPAFEISKTFGLMYLVAGSLGTLFGAWFSGFLSKKGYKDASVRVVTFVALLWLVPSILAPLMPNLAWGFIMAVPCVFFLNAYFGVAIASLQLITPNQLRAQVSALLLFMGNVFGLALGPMIIGFLSDQVYSDNLSLGYALSTVGAVFCPLAIALTLYSLNPYNKLLEDSESWA